ncbi:hypothetical protein [Chryseobacterium sp. 2987]|uniref:hypothetical protein n=1 Tax=Chryseobacterium sp. 2987 TaxID=2817767 RepID=UPI00285E5424|nr:hypothetical protein [Chryseobacterium sp. 2987]MDR6920021.1 hypothetical protein [Chryseobacterium sp. 2987]
MKNLRDKIERYVLTTEHHWKALSVEKQRLLTKVFFGGYVLITVLVIINVFISTNKRSNTMSINHIEGIYKMPEEKESGLDTKRKSPIKK